MLHRPIESTAFIGTLDLMASGSIGLLPQVFLPTPVTLVPLKFREREPLKWFIPVMAHVTEHGDCYRFAERQRIPRS